MITPESASPRPPPTPNTAEIAPIAVPTFSGGNSSLMIANASGKTAAPQPWRIRHPIRAPMFHAKIAQTLPVRKIEREITSIRSLPYWSPSLPKSGVATEAESRKPVSSHADQAAVVSNSCWRIGSAGMIIVCCSANAIPARIRTPSVML